MSTDFLDPIRNPERLAALRRLAILDTPAEESFDRLTDLACRALDTPVALVSLVDEERQFFKSCVGLPECWASRRETPLSHSFCQHVVASREPLIIEDARDHPFLKNNLAVRDLSVVAYAGIPLIMSDGTAVGSFCVIDSKPRNWTREEVDTLTNLAISVINEIELRAAVEQVQCKARLEVDSIGMKDGRATSTEMIQFDDVQSSPTATQQALVNTWLFRSAQQPEPFDLSDLGRIIAEGKGLAWMDLAGDTEDTLRQLAPILKLHPLSVQVALPPWQRPRLDVFKNYVFATATLVQTDPSACQLIVGELAIFVGKKFVVTIHRQSLPFFDSILKRAFQNPEMVQLHSLFLLYLVLDELLHYYDHLIETVEDEIENIEERGLEDTSDAFLPDLLRLKRYVFALGRLIDQHRTVVAGFNRPDIPPKTDDETAPYFRDLEARLQHIVDRIFAARESVNGAFDIYVSHMSHLTNKVIKILTIISTVLLPSSVIAGIFGTNFEKLPLYHWWPGGFLLMTAAMLILPAIGLYVLRKQRFI